MKKIILVIVIFLILVFIYFIALRPTEEKARVKILAHMKKEYGKEFNITSMSSRKFSRNKRWYEAVVYPKEYEGTQKENDEYYHGLAFVDYLGNSGDEYAVIMLNESTNKFYDKKLKELFGDKVLPIFTTTSNFSETDFLKNIKLTTKNDKILFIEGGVFIFGTVKNDSDKEIYREKIFQFIQFVKESGTEYVGVEFLVIDERVLSEEYRNNSELQDSAIKNYKKFIWENKIDSKQYSIARDKILSSIPPLGKKFNYEIAYDKINHSSIWERANFYLYTKVYTPKYIEAQYLDKEKKIDYSKKENFKFMWEAYK